MISFFNWCQMDYSGTSHFGVLRVSIAIVQIRVQSLQSDKHWERKKNLLHWAGSH